MGSPCNVSTDTGDASLTPDLQLSVVEYIKSLLNGLVISIFNNLYSIISVYLRFRQDSASISLTF